MEDHQLSPQARQARDEILDLLLQGQKIHAIQRYVQASGKGLAEAKTVIDRLSQVLEKPGLDEAEQAFLAGFRASLHGGEPVSREQPAPKRSRTPSARDSDADTLLPAPAPKGQSTPRSVKISNRLYGLAGLLLALTGLFFVGKNFFLASGQDQWVPVPAVVMQSYTSKSSSKGSVDKTFVNFHFKYRYQVDGTIYTGSRYSFSTLAGEQKAGVDRFRPGDKLTAYHHPTWHHYAVVERKSPSFFTWASVPLLLLIAIPSGWMLWTGKSNG
ncbi:MULTISPECIES: DUF3592 domain-containing protein [Thiorhodovibrio]|uniref:DUF3592 domain-containing protein n=1 Tax=Thiorhodovibrio TaxID=61593 RepID=UPI00191213B2|nr:DUF3592 domain-containing protein [Thiorhodovibrio litoralis]WPL12147.1 hypothetical protein Thiosp_01903 [Thiorhodovibrio litoralis]